jgi:hypothetical protein
MDIAELPVSAGNLTEQKRAPVPQTRRIETELVTRIPLGHRCSFLRDGITDQQPYALRAPEKIRIKTKFDGERLVEHQKLRIRCFLRLPRNGQLRELPGETALKGDSGMRDFTHLSRI